MSTESPTPTETETAPKSQQEHLYEAMHAVPNGDPQYAKRVIYAWLARMDLPAPFAVNQSGDGHTTHCNDCSSGINSVPADFHWDLWGSLCAECSLERFSNDGDNPRVEEREAMLAESRQENGQPGGQSYEIRKPGDRDQDRGGS